MKEANYLTGLLVPARKIWSLMTIAVKTGECEIMDRSSPSVLAGDDVIYLERQAVIRIRYPAVLATAVSTFPNLTNQSLIHRLREDDSSTFRTRRALDCIIERRLPT